MGALPVIISIGILVRNDKAKLWEKWNPTRIAAREKTFFFFFEKIVYSPLQPTPLESGPDSRAACIRNHVIPGGISSLR
jgi:hypothetical protein